MLKKVNSLLLAVCMLFCLSACEISELLSKSSSELKTDTTTQDDDEITPTESENNFINELKLDTEKFNENI